MKTIFRTPPIEIMALINDGYRYYTSGDWPRATVFFNWALTQINQVQSLDVDTQVIIKMHHHLGVCYEKQRRLVEACEQYRLMLGFLDTLENRSIHQSCEMISM